MKKIAKYALLTTFCALFCLSLGVSALAAAVTLSDVQALDQQVRDKIASLQSQSLTSAQTTKLTKAQKSYASLMTSGSKTASKTTVADTQRDAKITAFKATLSDTQKAALEAFMPSQPARSDVKPTGTAPKTADGTKPTAQMTDADRQAMESKRTAFVATLSDEQKKAFEEIFPTGQQMGQMPQTTGGASLDLSTLTSSQLTKMQKKLKTLLNTLNKI